MIDQESFNLALYNILKTRGYSPIPKNEKNQRTQPEEASVFNFTFKKDGKEYGNAWVTIDSVSNLILYYGNEQEESPAGRNTKLDYDDSWFGFKKQLKRWAMSRQMSFQLKNTDQIGDDMAQRDYVKKKEKMNEAYHPMGKKASYNDNIPAVKIILQHNRQIEEGEQRYRNIAKIFLENQDGERFLAPTTRPGIAQVYARHIAEGGVPNDERWNHIKSICEEYSKMAGFVRATRNKQFNESAQSLVSEGINHYQSLRETLGKLRGHRGYNQYFESWTPALMEDDVDGTEINELFVQETVDPRIESVMPILTRLYKKTGETTVKEVKELEQWADSIVEGEETLEGLNKSQYHDKTVSPKAGDKVIVVINTSPSWHRGETFEVVKVLPKGLLKVKLPDEDGPVLSASLPAEWTRVVKSEVEEDLDKDQKRAGQLGPTEKIGPEGARGKLVGVSESVDVEEGSPEHEGYTQAMNEGQEDLDLIKRLMK